MKNKHLILLLSCICLLFSSYNSFAKKRMPGPGDNIVPPTPLPFAVIKAQVPLEANDVRAFIWNTGVFDQDMRTNNTPGFEWPKNSGKFAIFTCGLSIGALYQGTLRMANASYNGEYAPGYVEGGAFKTDSRFKIYSVKAGDNMNSNPDWANWGLMIPFGAPWVDVNNDGIFDPAVDIPGIKDAGQTIFICLTDADPSNHTTSEGFSGGTQPLYAEVHLTAWAYNSPGLERLQFIQWVVINKSNVAWTSTHFGIVTDPDLGEATDDYIGCDIGKNMAFCYNADNFDGTGTGVTYGANPPASGMDYFRSPLVYTGNPNDIDTIYPMPGIDYKIIKQGYKQIGLTSFVYFTNTGSGGPTCENDPSSIDHAYNFLKGVKRDGTPWVNYVTRQVTKYCYAGDPETDTRTDTTWTEFDGRIENCGNVLTGPEVSPVPAGDRRYIFNSGATDFTINPNDTQYIVMAQMVARGVNHKNSVTLLKNYDEVAQKVYDLNFKVIPPPPQPQVNVTYTPNSNVGTVDITFTWDDAAERYYFEDQLFNTGFYKFQGYEIYEIKRSATTFPDFTNISSFNDNFKLLAIYDVADTIGFIYDSLIIGYNPDPVYAWAPVVPHFGATAPAGFPNTGMTRSIKLNSTYYQSENGNNTKFIYGGTYKFAIIAYGYNPNGLKGGKVIRNSLTSSIITVVPEAPLMGTKYTFKNGDTLHTNRRDLGLIPIVKNQELLVDAKYRIIFNSPDTTYNIYKSVDNWATSELKKANLKYTNRTLAGVTQDDSARIIDGILFKVMKIIMSQQGSQSQGDYRNNFGVIRDQSVRGNRDSTQTRYNYGWDYIPENNRNLEGSKYLPTNRKWQSVSMSISYPNFNTYTGFRSLLNPEDLRKVRIEFTGYGNGQMAYRYLNTAFANYTYQDMREVPFKVYEIDPYDNTPNPRQINCAFLEFPDSLGGNQNNRWEPTTDSLGGKEVLYIFSSDYNPNPDPFYTNKNLYIQQSQIDIMYVWSAKRQGPNALFQNGDQLIIYPYTVTRPEVMQGYPLYYEVESKAPLFSNPTTAIENNELDNIRVVPNPYYGFNVLETPTSGRFVTFRRLPKQCTIKIFTLNGDMIRKLEKNDNNSTLQWDLENQDEVPVASGIYIALIDAPGIGSKVIKLAIFTPEERIDF